MGLFGVKRYDHDGDNGGKSRHYFSVLSPEDLSVSKKLELPFDDDELVDGGSCGDVVYFYGRKGKTVIFNLQTNESIVVPPPEVLRSDCSYDPTAEEYTPIYCGQYGGCYEYDATYGEYEVLAPINLGRYEGCGVSYDAKSGEYKVIRIYSQYVVKEADKMPELKYFFDLYSVLSGAAKYITEPAREFLMHFDTSIFVGEAGSGSGSCYWAALPYGEVHSSDPLRNHVLSFDFATESFDQFPLPASPNCPLYKLVGCRGSLGVLVYWIPPDEFSIEADEYSSDLYVQLFVRNGNGKGTSWDLLYDVRVAGAERPIGLKDDRCLFLAGAPSTPSGDGHNNQLMVYYLASKTLKKLDIYNCEKNMSGIYFGDKRRRKKKGKGKEKEKEEEK